MAANIGQCSYWLDPGGGNTGNIAVPNYSIDTDTKLQSIQD